MTDALSELARERREMDAQACYSRVRRKQPEEGSAPARAPSMMAPKHQKTAVVNKYRDVRLKLALHTASKESLEALRTDTVRLLSDLYQLDPASMFRQWADNLDDTEH